MKATLPGSGTAALAASPRTSSWSDEVAMARGQSKVVQEIEQFDDTHLETEL
jgi:hypothetical protein